MGTDGELHFSLIFVDGRPNSTEKYTWNPNDPCFDYKMALFFEVPTLKTLFFEVPTLKTRDIFMSSRDPHHHFFFVVLDAFFVFH